MNGGSTEDALRGFLSDHAPVAGPSLLKPGDVVSGWTVTGFLGRGGSGEVYRVQSAEGKRFAALKVLVKDDAAARGRFDYEAEILARGTCTSLPALQAKGVWNGRPYLVMELLEPVELPEKESEIAAFLLELCAAVAELHAHGLVHRDIKPQNVMRRADGRIVLIDLGLAKDTDDMRPRDGLSVVSGHAVAVGTPGYAAPEQMQGGAISPAADIHALGRLANVCFKGMPPRAWVPIIRRSTSSIPEQRYASVAEFAAAIRARHRGRRMALALAGACLLLAGLFVCWRAREHVLVAAANEVIPTDEEVVQPLENVKSNTTIRLEGRKRVFERPFRIAEGRELRVEGPGVLDATVLAVSSNATVRLSGCVFLNRSTVPLDKAGIDYCLGNGSYLNFTALNWPKDWQKTVKRHVKAMDETKNACRFKGPETLDELRRQDEEEIKRTRRIMWEESHRRPAPPEW